MGCMTAWPFNFESYPQSRGECNGMGSIDPFPYARTLTRCLGSTNRIEIQGPYGHSLMSDSMGGHHNYTTRAKSRILRTPTTPWNPAANAAWHGEETFWNVGSILLYMGSKCFMSQIIDHLWSSIVLDIAILYLYFTYYIYIYMYTVYGNDFVPNLHALTTRITKWLPKSRPPAPRLCFQVPMKPGRMPTPWRRSWNRRRNKKLPRTIGFGLTVDMNVCSINV